MNLNNNNLNRCMNTILKFMGRDPRRASSYDSLGSVLGDFTRAEVQWSYNELVILEQVTEESGIGLNNDKHGMKLTQSGRNAAKRLRGDV